MTVIAWKDGLMAADSVSTRGDTRYWVRKLHRIENVVVAMTGNTDHCEALLAWFRAGRPVEKFPESQKHDSNYACAVFAYQGRIFTIDQTPYPAEMLAPFGALGVGRDFAIGALAAGADAVTAVKIACEWGDGCGGPILSEKYL